MGYKKYDGLNVPEVPDENNMYHSSCHKEFTRAKTTYEKRYNELMQDQIEVQPVERVESQNSVTYE